VQGAGFTPPTESKKMSYREWTAALDDHERDPRKHPHIYFKASHPPNKVRPACCPRVRSARGGASARSIDGLVGS
jgi:hypothetical protein